MALQLIRNGFPREIKLFEGDRQLVQDAPLVINTPKCWGKIHFNVVVDIPEGWGGLFMPQIYDYEGKKVTTGLDEWGVTSSGAGGIYRYLGHKPGTLNLPAGYYMDGIQIFYWGQGATIKQVTITN